MATCIRFSNSLDMLRFCKLSVKCNKKNCAFIDTIKFVPYLSASEKNKKINGCQIKQES